MTENPEHIEAIEDADASEQDALVEPSDDTPDPAIDGDQSEVPQEPDAVELGEEAGD